MRMQAAGRVFVRRAGWAGVALLGAACAATTPSPPTPVEHLVVLNAGDKTLTILPLTGSTPRTIPLGSIGGTPWGLAARGTQGLVTTGAGNTVAVVDLGTQQSVLVYRLGNGAGATGAAFVNDTLVYISNPFINRVTRLNLRGGDTTSLAVGQAPGAMAIARGRIFVANSNRDLGCADPLPCVLGPSWLTVIDPDRNVVIDSIALTGPGNASAITVGGDGLLYVVSSGSGGTVSGRLSIVDPVLRVEVGSFSGFGALPGHVASDGRERLFVTSLDQGLMEFNTRTRRLVRGAGAGIPLEAGVDAAVDANGLIYALEAGGCTPGSPGRIRIFRPDLTEARIILAGTCSVDATIIQLLPEE